MTLKRGRDVVGYLERLRIETPRTCGIMQGVLGAARRFQRKVVFAEGEELRVLHAVRAVLDEGCALPAVVGRTERIAEIIHGADLKLLPGTDFEIVEPQDDYEFRDQWLAHRIAQENGWEPPDRPSYLMQARSTAVAARLVSSGKADSMICGTSGQYSWHLAQVKAILVSSRRRAIGALSVMMLDGGPLFLADVFVNSAPTPHELAEIALASARHVRRFGLEPTVALCANTQNCESAASPQRIMSAAREILGSRATSFATLGPMCIDTALGGGSKANVLIFASAEAAAATRGILLRVSRGVEVGPILMGMANQAHIVTPSITSNGLLNIAALAGAPVSCVA
ncbi:phosphotransacetylase (plasmid) [Ensifer sp. WSM1721]|uniref:phosphate acyltransferase n=1 Tax=Ensifer sp. WSM1721 TaxID=1041159 RepID=UPI0006848E9E|nr:phosphate acyltransferase [Ensifer sp. WSM1721]